MRTLHGVFWFFVFTTTAALRAQIVAEPANLDLGRRAQDQTVEARVTLTNRGDSPAKILDVAADCSCTAADPEKRELAPGESTELKIRAETRGYQGEITRRVRISTSQGEVMIPVRMLVTAYENWVIKPNTLVLPPSTRGAEVSGTTAVDYVGDGSADIVEARTSASWLSAEIARNESGKFEVKITKASAAPSGNHSVRVFARTTDTKNPEIAFNVFVPVTSRLRLSPSPLVMPVAKVGATTTMEATLSGWSSENPPRFELKSGRVEVLRREGDKQTLSVAIAVTAPGASTQLLRVFDGDRLELETPIVLRAER